jgi:hypothetical protein
MKNASSYDGNAGLTPVDIRWQPGRFNATIFLSSHAGKMMKKIAIAGALLALTGCVQVDNYQDVIKHPVPEHLAGYWQSKGPQSKLVSPEAIATLVVTEEGDTLDCRQWQRVLAVPGKIMLRSDQYYNVTSKLDIYPLEREGSTLEYDGMELQKVDRPTVECADYLSKNPLKSKIH